MAAATPSRITHVSAAGDTADALIAATRRLEALWRTEPSVSGRADLAVAVTLTAHAALDALLPDETRGRRVRDSWRGGSVLVRAAHITGKLEQPLPADLELLCAIRHALGRSGEGAHAHFVRIWLDGDGVARAMALVDAFAKLCRPRSG